MAGLLPWDALFLAGFAYSGYRTLGRWLKYTDDVAKSQSDGAYMEGFREYLAQAAAVGDRAKPGPGAGADASGQGHLWRDFGGLRTKQRITLLQEMHRVLEWTGEDGAFRHLAKHRGKPWAALPHNAKKALLAAADQLDWSFLGDMAATGAALAKSTCLWQVTEPLPLLSEEPQLAEALVEETEALKGLVDSADLAVNALLASQQQLAIAALEPASQLKVVEAKRQLDLLREAAQGGLGLGSGGKASRGQQLLELLRGLALVPADASAQEAKGAAAAALDAAADEAVAPLKQQHASALATATGSARQQALAAALAQRIRHAPGRPPLTPAVAAGVIGAAADELTAALADVGALDAGSTTGLAARRLAAERLVAGANAIEGTAAALAAALGEPDEAGGAEAGEAAGAAVRALSEAAEALQDAAVKVVAAKLSAKPAPAAAHVDEDEDDSESAELAAEDKAAAAVGALEEALQAVRSAAAGLPAPAAAEGGAAEQPASAADVQAQLAKEVDEAVAAAEAKIKQQQETALQTARSRERMSALLAKAKKLMAPAPAAAANGAADGAGEAAAEAEPAMTPAEKLQVTEEFLKQLGARPLAAALNDLDKLLAAAGGGDAQPGAAAALAAGVPLEPASAAALQQLGALLSEIALADAVMKLELGPGVTATLDQLDAYLARLKARDAAGATEGQGGDEAAAAPPPPPPSPNLGREREAAAKCTTLSAELRSDGLVALGLSAAQYRTLALLRQAAGALAAESDALAYDRHVTALKDVAAQLGPIGAAVQVKLAATEDEARRQLLSQQKQLALDLYDRLKAFLHFEEEIRGPLKKALRELASLAGGIGAPRTTSGCAAAALKLDMAAEEAQKLQDLLAALATSAGEAQAAPEASPAPDSVAATQKIVTALQGSVEALQASLGNLAAHVALRARALDPDVAAAAAASGVTGEDCDLNSLEGMEPELDHPLTILAATADEQQAEWEMLGCQQVARGRVASVLLATAVADSHALNPTGDAEPAAPDGTPRAAVPVVGLPSGKSVLQLTAERILRLQQLAADNTFGPNSPVTRHVQWYIMTSPATHAKLEATLREHAYFGLHHTQVHLFECTSAPPAFAGEPLRALTLGACTLSRGAPGSGEVFGALKRSGMLRHMQRCGIRHIEINTVDDNVLARPADPVLVGFAAACGYDAAAKVAQPDALAPAYAAAMSGSAGAASAAAAGAGDAAAKGLLDEAITFLAPSIGSYYFSYAAASRVAAHVAAHPLAGYRLVPVAGLPSKAPPPVSVTLPPNATQAQRMQAQQALAAAQQAAANAPPKAVDGWVPMRLLSDLFAAAAPPATPVAAGGPGGASAVVGSPLEGCRLAYLGVERAEEFSVMFSTGPHLAVPSLEDAAGDLLALTTSWVEEQGGLVECDEGVEVSPLVSYAGEGLDALVDGRAFAEPYDLLLQGATGEGRPAHNAGRWAGPLAAAYVVGAGLALTRQLTGGGGGGGK